MMIWRALGVKNSEDCLHFLGILLQCYGTDNVLWRTPKYIMYHVVHRSQTVSLIASRSPRRFLF